MSPPKIRMPRSAITLTELLVVLSVISILASLLLPAVQAAREAARNTQCQSNLRQIGIAIASHESSHRALPAGGWGYRWVGDGGLGRGRNQPGGWIFQLLPQLEQDVLWHLSAHNKPFMVGQQISVMSCPSRPLQNPATYRGRVALINMPLPKLAFRNDYAGNGGDIPLRSDGGPSDSNQETVRQYRWEHVRQSSGVFYQYSEIRFREVTDGLSMTYGVGEKYATVGEDDQRDLGNDQCALIGDDHDIRRTTAAPPRKDGSVQASDIFGASHFTTWNALKLDGAVSSISYDIDMRIHMQLGNRSNGNFASH